MYIKFFNSYLHFSIVDLSNQREVSQEEAQKMANNWKCPFIETSSLTGENVEQSFDLLINQISFLQKNKIGFIKFLKKYF